MNMRDRWTRATRRLARPGSWRGAWAARAPAGRWKLGLLPVMVVVGAHGLYGRPGATEASYNSPETPLAEVQSDIALRRYRLQRADSIAAYAERFRIGFERAAMIYDAAVAEKVSPELAFRLVRVESSFRQRVVGPRGSVGLTQVQPRTAEWMDPHAARSLRRHATGAAGVQSRAGHGCRAPRCRPGSGERICTTRPR